MHPDWLSNSFAIADREGGTAVFVDSGADVGPLVAAVEAWGATPAAILRTHSHQDHVVHEHELRARFGVEVVAERLPLPVLLTVPATRVSPAVEATAYYVACEALANAVKHARASGVAIVVRIAGAELIMEITDDGVGGAGGDVSTGQGL